MKYWNNNENESEIEQKNIFWSLKKNYKKTRHQYSCRISSRLSWDLCDNDLRFSLIECIDSYRVCYVKIWYNLDNFYGKNNKNDRSSRTATKTLVKLEVLKINCQTSEFMGFGHELAIYYATYDAPKFKL